MAIPATGHAVAGVPGSGLSSQAAHVRPPRFLRELQRLEKIKKSNDRRLAKRFRMEHRGTVELGELGNAHLFGVTGVAEPHGLGLVALRFVPGLHIRHALAAPGGAAHAVGGHRLFYGALLADRFVRFDLAGGPPTGLIGAAIGDRADQLDAL